MEVDFPARGPVTRFGATAVAQGLGRISGRYVKRYMENTFNDYVRKNKAKKYKDKKAFPKRMKVSGGSGFYKGAFKALQPVTEKFEDMVLKKGSVGCIETFGVCQGNDILWIGASTCNIAEIAFHVAKAVLRKLFKAAGIHITNADEVFLNELIFPLNTPEASGFTLHMQYEDGPGNLSDLNYGLPSGVTLNSLANLSGIKQRIIDYANASSDQLMCSIKLFQNDNASTNTGKLVATLNMKNEMVHMHSSAKLVVQNRTKGATGTSHALDVIDAQPLMGKLYHFKKSNPELKSLVSTSFAPNLVSLLSRWSDGTVNLFSDGSPGYEFQIGNPPTPKIWNNCSHTANVSLEPGELKDVYISNVNEKYYQQFVRSLAWYNGSGKRRQNVGDCIYVVLEERLNSGSTNPIRVNYECEATFKCYVTTNRVDPIIKTFSTSSVNFVPP